MQFLAIVQRFWALEGALYKFNFYYIIIKTHTFASGYLTNKASTFKALQLKLKMRTGVLGLGEDLYRQERGTGMCKYCNNFESLKHFILQCPAYNSIRQKMYLAIKDSVSEDVFNMFLQDLDCAMYFLIGEHDNIFNTHFLSYLTDAWDIRKNF